MRFARFMASTPGRAIRIIAGLAAIGGGTALAVTGSTVAGIALIVVGAVFAVVGSINVCPLAPLFGGPLSGRKATAAR